ncbi:hypothetical protein LWI28_028346 [Acer negundo]|uniref:Retrovirus-related Pol polyprotein from transposon TNT 1-94-like beta-barrel domain-containing protein n=1 Tax=Acer negundo TaxID=4023 RepID=A0AAD5P033_ACENE|nr:hypothetical protein LWI28_028346 [Acer negundo]
MSKKKTGAHANYMEGSEEMLLMAYVNNKEARIEEMWFLDSGCSNHMCGKRELFLDFEGNFREKVKLGDNSSMDVVGKGNVRMLNQLQLLEVEMNLTPVNIAILKKVKLMAAQMGQMKEIYQVKIIHLRLGNNGREGNRLGWRIM